MSKQILITEKLSTTQDVVRAVASAVYPRTRALPHTLDGLADVLREYDIHTITAAHWSLDAHATARVLEVLRDNAVRLYL